MSKRYYRTLTIATSDSGGGAGIQADLKTFAARGCYGMSVIVALTAQNTQGVAAAVPLSTDFVEQQWQSVFSDIGVDAIKIGMLFNADIMRTVAQCLQQASTIPVVLDPVMIATSGDRLMAEDALPVMIETLLPLATLITPNIPEAEALANCRIQNEDDMLNVAKKLAELGPKAVLIKGGHFTGTESADVLYCAAEKKHHWLRTPRIDTRNTHGTGCSLSSAIAAELAKQNDIVEAVGQAKTYLQQAIISGKDYSVGQGHGPIHHFYQYWT